jgi:hypothetical protein
MEKGGKVRWHVYGYARRNRSVTNSEAIQRAIARYLDHEGETVVTLAEKLEVSHPTVVRWRNGETRVIRAQHWAKLRLLLSPYLENDPFEVQEPSAPYTASPGSVERRDVPVVDLRQVATYQPALQPLGEWYRGLGDRTEPWLADRKASQPICVDLGAEGVPPMFPCGSLLFVAAGEYPESGSLVLARLATQRDALVARYEVKGRTVSLTPVGKEEAIRLDPDKTPGRLVWVWPVVQARIDFR